MSIKCILVDQQGAKIQPIELGGTSATTAEEGRKNLGAAAVKYLTGEEYDNLPEVDSTTVYVIEDQEPSAIDLENAGGVLPITKGGTGATDAPTARNNLGVDSAIADAIKKAQGDGTLLDTNDVGNIHVWKRDTIYEEAVPAGYTLGSTTEKVYLVIAQSSSAVSAITYGSGISVSATGELSIVSPASVSISVSSGNHSVVMKNFVKSNAVDLVGQKSQYYFVPDTATVVKTSETISGTLFYVVYISGAQLVTGYPEIPAGTVTDYPTSTDRNAFGEGYQDYKPAGYTLGEAVAWHPMTSLAGTGSSTGVVYSDTVSVAADGTVSTIDNQSVTGSYTDYANFNACLGKFVSSNTSVYYIPSDATVIRGYDGRWYYIGFSKAQPVIGYPETGSAYLTYLGALGDKARIEVGSYVGTGTYGASNPNTLTFWFEPKVVWICAIFNPTMLHGMFSNYVKPIVVTESLSTDYKQGVGFSFDSQNGYAKRSKDGKALSWYVSSAASSQFNTSGFTYYYVAIG